MNLDDWLWEPPMGIPEAEDIGPALSEEEIRAWEQQHGIELPEILHRAYKQQDGGMIRHCSIGAALLRLKDICIRDVSELDTTWCEGKLDTGRLIDIGYDDTGSTLLLHYAEDGSPPAVYAYYFDGGTMHVWGETVEALWTNYRR